MLLKVHKIKLAYYSGSETSPRSSKTFPSWSLAMKPLSVQKQTKASDECVTSCNILFTNTGHA